MFTSTRARVFSDARTFIGERIRLLLVYMVSYIKSKTQETILHVFYELYSSMKGKLALVVDSKTKEQRRKAACVDAYKSRSIDL